VITRLALLRRLKDELQEMGLQEEVESSYRLIAEHLYNAPFHLLYTQAHEGVTEAQIALQEHILMELRTGKPLQYILGSAYFYDRAFRVTPDTLIPRRETEELCAIVLRYLPPQISLCGLDLCTGSGCIAITLALENAHCTLEALDVSPAALAIARENAQCLKADVAFVEADLYRWEGGARCYDFIVSNPPYIPQIDGKSMSRRVYDFEPHLALFVPTKTPLLPYQRIAYLAARLLKNGGFVACEIYETLGQETAEVFRVAGLKNVSVHCDFWGKERFVLAMKE